MMDSHSFYSKIRKIARARAIHQKATVCARRICGLFLSIFLFSVPPAFAATATSQTLNRLASLESRWGHLQLGGKITFSADYFTYDGVFNPEAPGGNRSLVGSNALWQELQIFLNARLDRHFDLSLGFAGQDFYGTQQLSGFSLLFERDDPQIPFVQPPGGSGPAQFLP